MTYIPTTWVDGVTTIDAAQLNRIEAGIDNADSRAQASWGVGFPWTVDATVPTVFSLLIGGTTDTHGSPAVASNGVMIPPGPLGWTVNRAARYQTLGFTSGTNTVAALLINRLFYFPTHGALTITKLEGRLLFANYSGSGAAAQFTAYEVQLVKVSGAGVETVLQTITASGDTSTNTGTTGKLFWVTFSQDLGAGYTLASTERLGIRVRVTGRTAVAGTFYHAMHAAKGETSTTDATPHACQSEIAAWFS